MINDDAVDADAVLQFWFVECDRENWFKQSDDFDALCATRFLPTLMAAARGDCWGWRKTPGGRAAEIIVLDQLSRNIYRDSPKSYAQDGMALALAQEAVASGDHLRMSADERYFSYMPYMHAESRAVHEQAVLLFEALGNADALRYEHGHRAVIERFGRYPSRNAVLGRASTNDELAYLKDRKGW